MNTVNDYWRLRKLVIRYNNLMGDCNSAFLPEIEKKPIDYTKYKEGAKAAGLAALGAYGLAKVSNRFNNIVLKIKKMDLQRIIDN